MIKVTYMYFRKSDRTWVQGETRFDDCRKAARFIRSITNKGYRYIEYQCDSREDLEYLTNTGC